MTNIQRGEAHKTRRLARLMGGASIAVMVAYGPAVAQTLNITIDATQVAPVSAFTSANVTGFDTVDLNTQDARAAVTASIAGGVLNSDVDASDASSVTITENNLSANASGNTFSLTAEQLGTDGSGSGGTLGLLSGQFADETITSTVTDSSLTISGSGDAASTSLAASDNTISATTTVNRATVVFSDEISADLAGDLAGSGEGFSQAEGETITLTRGNFTGQELLSVDGGASVVASTQVIEGGAAFGSSSVVDGSAISVALGDTTASADATDSLVTVDGNDLRSSLTGNLANVGTDVTVDTAFDGSAGVFNQQQIGDGGTAVALSATTDDSALSVTLGESINSSLVVSDNTIGASARGNVATLDGTGPDSTLADGTSLSINATSITADANGGRINISDGGTTEFTDATAPAEGTDFGFVAGTQQAVDGDGGTITASNNGNDLSISGTGALTGSSISVEDNTAFAIASANAGGTAINLTATNITATAGLASDQSLRDKAVTSNLGAGTAFALSADVDGDVSGSSVLVDGNLSVAEASGNTGRTTLSAGADTALLSSSTIDRAIAEFAQADGETTTVGDFALAANQSVVEAPVTVTAASNGTVTIGASTGTAPDLVTLTGAITDSTVSVSRNVQQATASGNTLTNRIDLDGNTIGSEGTTFADNVSAVSALGSTQQFNSDVVANSTNTLSLTQDFFSDTTAVADSSLLVNANENRSSATANRAINTLAVTADTTIVGADATAASAGISGTGIVAAGGTAALSNFQETSSLTSILANTSTVALLDVGNEGAPTTAGLTDSSASISDNITTASGAANIGTSTIGLDAGTELSSTAALVNLQGSGSDVIASAAFDAANAGTGSLEITGPVANSTVGIDDNTVIASGMGNQTTNTLSVTATTIDRVASTDTGSNVVSVAAPDATADFAALNRQNQTGSITSSASARGLVSLSATSTDGTDGTLTNSSASLDGNALQSDAMSNLATNRIDLTGTAAINETTVALGSLQTSGANPTNPISVSSSSSANFAFQTANGAVTDSSVSIDGNQAFDSATSNQATNTVSLAGNSISGEAGTLADVGVTLEPTLSSSARADNSLSSVQTGFAAVGSSSSITGLISSGGQPFSGSDASVSQNFARSFGMGNSATNTLDLMAATSFSGTGALTGTQVQFGDVASAATVTATIIDDDDGGGSLDGSIAVIDENIAFSRSSGNDQTNALSIEGTSITGVSDDGEGAMFSALGDSANTRTLEADNVVSAFQGLRNGDVTGAATLNGNVDTTGIITDSSVSASNNIAQSNVTGNRGNNLLNLAADTTVNAASVLTSEQSGRADDGETNTITSSADLRFDIRQNGAFAPIGSALNIDGNVGFLSAIGNDVTNRLDVSGTSVVGQDNGLSTAEVTAAGVVSGTSDNLLGNFQSRVNNNETPDLEQTAVTSTVRLIMNQQAGSSGDTSNSTITVSDNILDSTATSNRAINTLALNAETALTAGGAISNQQSTDSPVVSGVELRTSVGNPSLDNVAGSSFEVKDNTGIARATGNDATNVLNASAGTVIAGVAGSGTSTVSAGVLNASGTFATASNQLNTGTVMARASSGNIGGPMQSSLTVRTVALNNSSVELSGNRLLADAVSNRVSNTISLSGRSPSTDVTTALTSRQVATGAVTSRVDTLNLASNNGALDASSVGLSGNTFSASAGGNIATSRLVRD